jgi:hypothetical protein
MSVIYIPGPKKAVVAVKKFVVTIKEELLLDVP